MSAPNYGPFLIVFKHLLKYPGVVFKARELGNMAGVSRRTIYRIIYALQDNFVPVNITQGKSGGIWLEKDYKFQ